MKEQLRPARTRKREYNATVKRAEQELAAVLKAYAEAQQAYTNAHETNMILAEMLDMQECMAAVYQKHLRWMAAGGPTEAWPEQEAVLLADDRPSWVMFLLETATWEQQQRALSMSTDDWMLYHRQFIADLQELMEINSKCPDVQTMMLGLRGALPQPPPTIPTVYAVTNSSISASTSTSGTASSRSRYGPAAEGEDLPASGAILHLLKQTGVLMFVALLHGCPALYECAGRNMLTGEVCQPSPMHWVSVAKRVKFSRQQKQHCKLALQVFARQAKAAAASGLTILQETPSYAFLLACETIAARQLSSDDSPAPAGDAAQDMPAQHAEAAGSGPKAATGESTATQREAAGPASATAVAAAAAVETGGRRSGAGGSSMSTDGMQEEGSAAQPNPGTEQEGMLVDTPAEDLQRQMMKYAHNIINLNIFLNNTMTLEQGLVLNVASFPFWPMLSAVAEAAIQLPDDDTPEPDDSPHMQGVQLLMRQRRSLMQQLHSDWIEELRNEIQ